jgi:hypothetical protein
MKFKIAFTRRLVSLPKDNKFRLDCDGSLWRIASLIKYPRGHRNALDVDMALRVFNDAYEVDFVTYHLSQTSVDTVDAPYVRTTYSDAWMSRYLRRGYVTIDPVICQGFQRQLAFDWREVEISDADLPFLEDAHQHGIGINGFSIPIVDKFRRALLSLNSNAPAARWTSIIADARPEWIADFWDGVNTQPRS